MEAFLGALLIFLLRIGDVSIGTLRVLYVVRGKRAIASALGFLEAGIFITAISQVFAQIDNPLNMIGYAAGFATGTAVGITLEGIFTPGHLLMRTITRHGGAVAQKLHAAGFGSTLLSGEGREGEVQLIFTVVAKARFQDALAIIQEVDPQAFVTSEAVERARGGHLPKTPLRETVRK